MIAAEAVHVGGHVREVEQRDLLGVAVEDGAGQLRVRVVDARVDHRDDDVGVAEGSRRIHVAQRLPGVGCVD